jgi:hypothetical protein
LTSGEIAVLASVSRAAAGEAAMARHKPKRPKVSTLPALPSQELPPAIQLRNGRLMNGEWMDPAAGATHSAAPAAKQVRGLRAFDPLRRLNGRSGSVSAEQIAAADQLRLLHDGSRIGFSADRDMLLPVSALIYRPSSGPGRNALKQAKCGMAWPDACACSTPRRWR